ncbi:MAG TPA: ABC transporter permease, partial [Gemmatirosa sp.]
MPNALATLRHAWRALRRTPGYLTAAVLTLALGIGATTALFGVVDRVLLRPLPYREPARLVRVWDRGVSDGLLDAIRTRSTGYADVAAFGYAGDATVVAATGFGRPAPSRARTSAVTGNLFDLLGVRAALGRTLRPDDGRPSAAHVVVLSDAYWRERMGADPRVVGRSVTIDGERHEIVGVMPPAFRFPSATVAIWMPVRIDPADVVGYWWNWRLNVIARLAPGTTAGRAEAETRAIVGRAGEHDFPQRMQAGFGRDLRVLPLQAALVGGARATLVLLFGGVAVMLVVAVVNATGLALVRAAGRARELTVRAAVGAGRARLVAQLVAEGVVVAGIAAMLGAALAWALTRALAAAIPATLTDGVPGAEALGLDARALAFACAVALTAGVGAALLPALRASRVDLRG